MTTWRRTGGADTEIVPAASQELMALRAEVVRHKPAQADEDEALFWVAEFPVGDDQYAVPMQALRGALPLKGVTAVPLAPPQIIGILRFQGQVVTVLSLASLLGNPGWREDPQTLLVLEIGAGRLVAVDCEQIPKPNALPRRLVEQARATPGRTRGAVLEIQTADHRQIQLLDVHKLIDRRREARDET